MQTGCVGEIGGVNLAGPRLLQASRKTCRHPFRGERPWPFALHWDSVRWDIESFHATLIDGIDRQLDARALLCGSGESGQ